jgi:hypothetical protein
MAMLKVEQRCAGLIQVLRSEAALETAVAGFVKNSRSASSALSSYWPIMSHHTTAAAEELADFGQLVGHPGLESILMHQMSWTADHRKCGAKNQ